MIRELPRSNKKRWNIIYPIYINAKAKYSDGRKLPLKQCVERPTAHELGEIAKFLKLPHEVEELKAYSRDFMQRGRLRVQIRSDDNKPLNPDVPSRKRFMIFAGEHIGKLVSRRSGGGGGVSGSGRSGRRAAAASTAASVDDEDMLPPEPVRDDDETDAPPAKTAPAASAPAAGGKSKRKGKRHN